MDLNLNQLITQSLSGSRQAFEILIRRYQKLVYGFAFQRTRNFADAEDLTQEAFLQAYQNLHTLREPEKFAGWMRGITFHLCNRWLTQRRHVVLVDDTEMEVENISIAPTSTPEAELDQKEQSRMVTDAINLLPESMRQVVILYYIDEMRYKEIAEFLELPVSTIKGRLQSSKQLLKKGMSKMVEQTLQEQSPDEAFTQRTLAQIFEEVERANEQWNRKAFIQQCEKVSQEISTLSDSDEKKEAEIKLLRMRADADASWLGEPKEAYKEYERAYSLIKKRQLTDQVEEAEVLKSLTQACGDNYDYDRMKRSATQMEAAYKSIGDPLHSALGSAFAAIPDIPFDADKSQNHFMVSAFSLKKEPMGLRWDDVVAYRCRDFGKAHGMPSFANTFSRLFSTKTLLSLPSIVGESWTDVYDNDGHRIGWGVEEGELIAESCIESDVVSVFTPAGEFENCLKVVTIIKPKGRDYGVTFRQRSFCGARTVWFAPRVGIVKIRYCRQQDDRAEDVHLVAYEVSGDSKDYLPSGVGNWWRYQWVTRRNFGEYHTHDEVCRVSDQIDDTVYLSCAQWVSDSSLEWAEEHLKQLLAASRKIEDKWTQIVRWYDLHDLHGRQQDAEVSQNCLERAKSLAESLAEETGRCGMNEKQLMTEVRNEMLGLRKAAVIEYAAAHEAWLEAANHIAKNTNLEGAASSGQRAAELYQKMHMTEEMLKCENIADFAREKLRNLQIGVEAINYVHGRAKRTRDAHAVSHGDSQRCTYIMKPPLDNYSATISDWDGFAVNRIPLQPEIGEKWDDSQWNRIVKGESTVESLTDTVATPMGTFVDCMRVVSNFVANAESEIRDDTKMRKTCYPGTRTCWFAKGIGLVKLEYKHGNGSITDLHLVEHGIKPGREDYLPLDEGNWWRHEWTNDKGEFRFHQFTRVVLKGKEEDGKELFYLSFISHILEK